MDETTESLRRAVDDYRKYLGTHVDGTPMWLPSPTVADLRVLLDRMARALA